jgi:diguanylate cyclase (GGDEF)-like protein
MRLGSLIYRYARSSVVLSLLSVTFIAAVALRFWPESALRLGAQRYLPCVACDADQLVLHISAGALITVSYCALAAAFLVLFVLCGRRLPWRGIWLGIALLFAAWAVSRAVQLFNLWHPVPGLIAALEVLTAILAACAAGIVPLLVPPATRFLLHAQESRREEARFLAATENSLDAFYILQSVRDEDGNITDFAFTYLNQNGERLLGRPRHQALGAHLCVLMPINRTGGFFEDYARVVQTGEPIVHEFPSQPGEETTRWIRHQVVRLDDGIAITASDITERKQSEQLAQHRAQHDILTGLPNRSLLNDRLRQAMERADRYQQKVAVFMVDLDSFKQINDTLGHMAGDLVLVTVATRLRDAVRATDSVLRIGGDEFLVVMPDVAEDLDILRSAAKLLAALAHEGPPGLETQIPSCSLGIAIYPTLARSATDLVTRADIAMYRAKDRGGNCYELYSPEAAGSHSQTTASFPPRTRDGSPRAAARFAMPPASESH